MGSSPIEQKVFLASFPLEKSFRSPMNQAEPRPPFGSISQIPALLLRTPNMVLGTSTVNQPDQSTHAVNSPSTTAITRCQSKDEQEFFQDNSCISDLSFKLDNSMKKTCSQSFTSFQEDVEGVSKLNKKSKKIIKYNPSTTSEDIDNKKSSNKGKRSSWSSQEDAQLLDLMNIYGKKWSKIASAMKERSGKQVRDRYVNVLMPDINRKSWEESEDQTILAIYHKIGPKWSKIAESLKGRTEGQVKNRFYSFLRKQIWKEEESTSTTKSCESDDIDVNDCSSLKSEKQDQYEYNKLQECLQRVEEITQMGLLNHSFPVQKADTQQNFQLHPSFCSYIPDAVCPGYLDSYETYHNVPDPTDCISFADNHLSEVPGNTIRPYWTNVKKTM